MQKRALYQWFFLCIQKRVTRKGSCKSLWRGGKKRVAASSGNYELWYRNALEQVLFPSPPTYPRSAWIQCTNLYGWQGFSSLASGFKFIANGNIATEFCVCWLRPIMPREWLSEGDGWACKGKCASNVDYCEVIGLGAIDQNEKSILNGKIMQHAAKGKDLRTIPKSHNPSLGLQLKKTKSKNKRVAEDRTQKCIQSSEEYKWCKDVVALQGTSWTLSGTVTICHCFREECLTATALEVVQQHPARTTQR